MSGRQDWRAPAWLVRALGSRFAGVGFALDAAATKDNAVAPLFWSKETNGLKQEWIDVTFCNPPYRDISPWTEKAANELGNGVESVLVLPVGCSQAWFHVWILGFADVYYPNRRINYMQGDGTQPKNGADRDTMICHYRRRIVESSFKVFDAVRAEKYYG